LDKRIERQKIKKGEKPGVYAYPVKLRNRDKVKKYLQKKGIETKIWNYPLISDSPAYKRFNKNDTPNAKKILNKTLNIPFHEKLTNDQIKHVVDSLNFISNKYK